VNHKKSIENLTEEMNQQKIKNVKYIYEKNEYLLFLSKYKDKLVDLGEKKSCLKHFIQVKNLTHFL
jgi:uncharacterized membrane protein